MPDATEGWTASQQRGSLVGAAAVVASWRRHSEIAPRPAVVAAVAVVLLLAVVAPVPIAAGWDAHAPWAHR